MPGRSLSWPGVILSQGMAGLLIWAERRWGLDFWWTTAAICAASGYAVTHLHPPYRSHLLHLAVIYGTWLAGVLADLGARHLLLRL